MEKALEELNAYLAAVGKENFVAKPNPPKITSQIFGIGGVGGLVRDREYDMPGLGSLSKIPPIDIPFVSPSVSMPDYQAYRAGERGDIIVTVNNAGSAIAANDLTETVRNGILAGQTSGRSINARVLDL